MTSDISIDFVDDARVEAFVFAKSFQLNLLLESFRSRGFSTLIVPARNSATLSFHPTLVSLNFRN